MAWHKAIAHTCAVSSILIATSLVPLRKSPGYTYTLGLCASWSRYPIAAHFCNVGDKRLIVCRSVTQSAPSHRDQYLEAMYCNQTVLPPDTDPAAETTQSTADDSWRLSESEQNNVMAPRGMPAGQTYNPAYPWMGRGGMQNQYPPGGVQRVPHMQLGRPQTGYQNGLRSHLGMPYVPRHDERAMHGPTGDDLLSQQLPDAQKLPAEQDQRPSTRAPSPQQPETTGSLRERFQVGPSSQVRESGDDSGEELGHSESAAGDEGRQEDDSGPMLQFASIQQHGLRADNSSTLLKTRSAGAEQRCGCFARRNLV
jgi:hypothetical protein